MLTQGEIEQLKAKRITIEEFEKQLLCFQNGFPLIEIVKSATTEDGIVCFTAKEKSENIAKWKEFQSDPNNAPAMKFVPASGAASRMFKDLYEYKASGEENNFIYTFFNSIKKFPFYSLLQDKCIENEGLSVEELVKQGRGKDVVSNLLDKKGLNYGSYPKGVLPFHAYAYDLRTPFGEHLAESAMYTRSANDEVKIHFTVSQEHMGLFQDLVEKRSEPYKKANTIKKLDISFSVQDESTDTIAVDMNNNPIKSDDGHFLFRPGGHGSLLKNLNSLDADIIFIKNIDNVVPDMQKKIVIEETMALGGYFLKIRNQVWAYLTLLKEGVDDDLLLNQIVSFCDKYLFIKNIPSLKGKYLAEYLRKKLNRPIRVCGMVRNLGEPGGGPYYCKNQDGTESLQILERNQISDTQPAHVAALKKSTHFNPVNMVCGLNDFEGKKFNLNDFVDPNTAFISTKSKNGISLKALEHPGLWNGSMSDWITIFVEMDAETFNPVKTVNDLLRPMHQQP